MNRVQVTLRHRELRGQPHSPILVATGMVLPARRRRHRVLALFQANPAGLWRLREIAAPVGGITLRTMYRHFSRWADGGLIHKMGPGPYATTASMPLA